MRRTLISLLFFYAGLVAAVTPGLDNRGVVGAYLNGVLPTTIAIAMPMMLSDTGAFSNTVARTPHLGLVPYALNSQLWTDGAIKSRFIALPFNGTIGDPGSPKIGFNETGSWTFPNGTVIVKNFDMLMDERLNAVNAVRRLETRILIRNADGTLRGATYKWNVGETDATRIEVPTNELLTITLADGNTRMQNYLYPGPNDCLRCHNTNAGMVLGIKTAQLNGDVLYTQTNRTDNQLHTFSHLGMLSTTLADTASYPAYPKMSAVVDTSATLENRVRSYLASNCGHCHRGQGNGEAPLFDARYETPMLEQNIANPYGVSGALIRRNLAASRLYVRDSVTVTPNVPPPITPMPPLARNIPDPALLATYADWVNDAYDIATVTALSRTQVRVQFNRAVEPVSAADSGNYALNNFATVLQATLAADPSVVLLTTTSLAGSGNYNVTVNRVKDAAAPLNPIWPNTVASFTAPAATVPGAPTIATTAAGNAQVTLSFTAPASDGGAPITGYAASCTPGPFTAPSTGALSITVTGLSNGTVYDCSVTATNSVGTGAASPGVQVTPIAPPVPVLTGVGSRKTHGAAGMIELPIAGLSTVEPRIIGSGHLIVFQFDIRITSPGTVTLQQYAPASGAVASAVAIGNTVVVTLTGVTDNQRIIISLSAINGVQSDAAASIGFLVGDVNNTGSVNSSDISGVKARSGQATTALNFRFDVNASGAINSSDISAVKARSGLTLP